MLGLVLGVGSGLGSVLGVGFVWAFWAEPNLYPGEVVRNIERNLTVNSAGTWDILQGIQVDGLSG